MSRDARSELVRTLETVMRADARIVGLVMIGSGASGFRDELSDVDLMAVVSAELDAVEVGDALARDLASQLPLYRHVQTPPARARGIHVFLLEGHLELDLSFVSIGELRATSERFRILFDRDGGVAQRMSLPPSPGPARGEQARFRYLAGSGALWFGLKALSRGEYLLATERLGELRAHVMALACIERLGSDAQAAQRADALPESDRSLLQRLTCAAVSAELRAAFGSGLAALARYDQALLQAELGDMEYAGLAEWLASKYEQTTPGIELCEYDARFAPECERLIQSLPHWFGQPDSNAAYLRDLGSLPSWVALRDDAEVVGAITLESHLGGSFEVHFMAVRPELHRQGVGRSLLARLESEARARGGTRLCVRTLASSHPDPHYARTRAFYAAMGFEPLFETSAFWGAENPTIVMVKTL